MESGRGRGGAVISYSWLNIKCTFVLYLTFSLLSSSGKVQPISPCNGAFCCARLYGVDHRTIFAVYVQLKLKLCIPGSLLL